MSSETIHGSHREDMGVHYEQVRAYCEGMHRLFAVAQEVRQRVASQKLFIVDLSMNAVADRSLQPLLRALDPRSIGAPLSEDAVREISNHAWVIEGMINMTGPVGPESAAVCADLQELRLRARCAEAKQ